MSIGWVDLSHIMDLFAENRTLTWLTTQDVDKLLLDPANRQTVWDRPHEYKALRHILEKREMLKRSNERSIRKVPIVVPTKNVLKYCRQSSK
jgi:hypothetical protein